MMKVQSDIPRTEKRRSVQDVHGICESPLSEPRGENRGFVPLTVRKRGRF